MIVVLKTAYGTRKKNPQNKSCFHITIFMRRAVKNNYLEYSNFQN